MISDGSGAEVFDTEGNDTHASDDEESPSKKVKTGRKAIIKLEDSELEDEKVDDEGFLVEPTTMFA